MTAISNAVRRFYARPMRKGAMLSWREAKTFYWLSTGWIALLLIFAVSAYLEDDALGTLAIVFWSISLFCVFGLTIFAAMLYGYHNRGAIDPGNEEAIDLSKAYLGGLLAVVIAPIVRLILDYFGV